MARVDGGKPTKPWQPLKHARLKNDDHDKWVRSMGGVVAINDQYQVTAVPLVKERGKAGPVHLSIKRRDRQPIMDWRALQQIKTDLMGEAREALQLFPAESRLVDEANQWHLWVLPEGAMAPFGFVDGRWIGSPEQAAEIGAVQRDWVARPLDVDTRTELQMDVAVWDGTLEELV